MIWRLIRFEYRDAAMNMALDEAISNGIERSTSPPTIRFYGWKPSAVSIGRFQSLVDEVDIAECNDLGIEMVRRRTGGGAVYHDTEGEITYSLIAPEGLMPRDISTAYQEICGFVVSALAALGVDAQFSPINDILVGGKKISGSAQSRRHSVFLQHGTLLLELDAKKMFKVLRVARAKIAGKDVLAAEQRVTCLRVHSDASKTEILAELEKAFTSGKQFSHGSWSGMELGEADRLVSERYANKDWTRER
jgi:lipoate-protein ligase A